MSATSKVNPMERERERRVLRDCPPKISLFLIRRWQVPLRYVVYSLPYLKGFQLRIYFRLGKLRGSDGDRMLPQSQTLAKINLLYCLNYTLCYLQCGKLSVGPKTQKYRRLFPNFSSLLQQYSYPFFVHLRLSSLLRADSPLHPCTLIFPLRNTSIIKLFN